MLRVNAALAYAAGYQDLINDAQADRLRNARADFLYQASAFEKDQMWAARAWNRAWKKQGLPEGAYPIIKSKFDTQFA